MDKSTFFHLNDLHVLKIQFPTAATVVAKKCGCRVVLSMMLRSSFFHSQLFLSSFFTTQKIVCSMYMRSEYRIVKDNKSSRALINNKWIWITSRACFIGQLFQSDNIPSSKTSSTKFSCPIYSSENILSVFFDEKIIRPNEKKTQTRKLCDRITSIEHYILKHSEMSWKFSLISFFFDVSIEHENRFLSFAFRTYTITMVPYSMVTISIA